MSRILLANDRGGLMELPIFPVLDVTVTGTAAAVTIVPVPDLHSAPPRSVCSLDSTLHYLPRE